MQYSIEGRDLERAVRDGQKAVDKAVSLPQGYWLTWGGEYSQFLEAEVAARAHWSIGRGAYLHDSVRAVRELQVPVTIALGVI